MVLVECARFKIAVRIKLLKSVDSDLEINRVKSYYLSFKNLRFTSTL